MSDSDYEPSNNTTDDEYNTDDDDFLTHRDSDELDTIMKEYNHPLKINLYTSIELKVNPSNQDELEDILLFLISKGIDFNKDITFIT